MSVRDAVAPGPVLGDPLGAAEAAIIARLVAELAVPGGSLVREVGSLPGDWDDELLGRLLRDVPGVYVALAGGPLEPGQGVMLRVRWLVYVVTAHHGGEEARRLGDALAVGAYALAARCAKALHDWAPDGGNTCQLVELSNLYTGAIDRQGVAVYALTVEQLVDLDAGGEQALALFETFAVSYDVRAFAGAEQRAAWLAGSEQEPQPDAADTVTLPTE